MKRINHLKGILFYSSCFLIIYFYSCMDSKEDTSFPTLKINYPETRMDSLIEDYHGNAVADPFRWLEDDNSEETMNWVDRQNVVTQDYLEKIPFRKDIEERLTSLWDYEKYSNPFKEGDWYYYFKNDGLQNQSVLYRTKTIDGEGEVFLDPNSFSDDGTSSLAGLSFNKDGSLLAYMVSEGGSDWMTAYVMDTKAKKLLSDTLNWLKFTGTAWANDGFYYSRYPAPSEDDELSGQNQNHSLYHHKIGDSQENDKLIYHEPENPLRNIYAGTTDDENFLIISVVESTSGNQIKVKDLRTSGSKIINVVDDFDADFNIVTSNEDELIFSTNYNAPKSQVIAINIKETNKDNWKALIPESGDALRSVSVVGNKIFASYIHNASSLVKVFDIGGNYLQDLELPGIGTVNSVGGKKNDKVGFYSYTSFTTPSTIYSLNTETLVSDVFREPNVDFDPGMFTTEQVWYDSKDGTKVPMFITYKKGMIKNGLNPTVLYGYGGFNISILPSFSLTKIPLLESGGVYAVANIRGGGEFGKEWHKSGTLEQKQNVFDDFIAAGEYLISEKYTNSDKLGIEGGSNGGLLVGACMTQRPDLFAVAFPRVGVLDMLRYHKFTIGWAWATDYGKSDDPEAFDYLIKYSPLHNVNKAAYPATMVMTADHDDRVVPAHSFKFAAELQRKHNGHAPALIRIDKSAGHGAGKPTSKTIEENADMLSFLLYNTNSQFKKEIKG